ncbi:MAG: hypothetical protein EXX96DRAFT_536446 [Benjaminiella poitrasii]|nr:MAG: hypothetical protein EXX96DRAFT_536446 [Benjaminiella poitrasii]
MCINDSYAQCGWLHKTCRFSLMHQLKLRYFVLSDTELRYYKQPDDIHTAGAIELENFSNVEAHNTTSLYGFRLISTKSTKSQWIPILYAQTDEERQLWMERIRSKLKRINEYKHYPSLQHSNQIVSHDKDYHSVLEKWLDRLDLYDEDDVIDKNSSLRDSHNNIRRSSSSCSEHSYTRHHHLKSNSIASTTKVNSIESFSFMHSNNSGNSSSSISTGVFYSEPASLHEISSSSSSLSSGSSKRQHSAPATALSLPRIGRRRNMSTSDSTHYRKNSMDHTCTPTDYHKTLTRLLSLESEKKKYAENTTQNYQHQHIHRSSTKSVHPELITPLSPPPPRK